jgi:hypothetical protein
MEIGAEKFEHCSYVWRSANLKSGNRSIVWHEKERRHSRNLCWRKRLCVICGEGIRFRPEGINGIWTEIWKSSDPAIKEPKIDRLSEQDVLQRMTGRWVVDFGVIPDRLTLTLHTNRAVEVSGEKQGVAWRKTGEWRVVSNKLVLFLKEDSVPSFIFRTRQRDYIFDPWAETMMSELKREK